MTFCIVARDPETRLLGIAQATNPMAVGARCPYIRAGVGAVSSQAFTDPALGPLALNLLALGYAPDKVIKELGESDPHYAWRQIGIVDRLGRTAVHTGDKAEGAGGAIQGDGYLVMGNYLADAQVVPRMDQAWHASAGQLFESRLMAAVLAARDAGGDKGGHRSACLMVHDADAYVRTDLRIDFMPKLAGQPDALDALKEALDRWIPLIEYFKQRPHNPQMPGWADWLTARGTAFQD